MTHRFPLAAFGLAVALVTACIAPPPDASAADAAGGRLRPVLETEPVGDDPDDPAIWVPAADPSRALILGTNKTAAPSGALVVFGLDGRIRQTVPGLDRPNNVDVEYGFRLGERTIDIAVVTERYAHRLRVYEIDAASGDLRELGRVPVLEGETGEAAEPMGIALYRRPGDDAIFAIIAPKTGRTQNYLWQYRLEGAAGEVRGILVRRFGAFSGAGPAPGEAGEIEAVVVDDALGFVYFADERYGIRKWAADPDDPFADRELATFGTSGYAGDREGLAIYMRPDGTGWLVSTDQIEGGSVFKIYAREGRGPSRQHDLVCEVRTSVDETDGLEITSAALPGFPGGLVVAMNSGPRTFALFDWAAFLAASTGSASSQPAGSACR